MLLRTKLFLGIVLIFLATNTYSQPGGGGPGDPDVPITGVEYLLGAGALYGLRRILEKQKKNRIQDR